jgi:rod shape-determining protein MreC
MFCLLVSMALLVTDARYRYLDGIRQVAAIVLYPFQRVAAAPGAVFSRLGEFFVTQSALRSQNEQLFERNLQDAALLQKYKALAAENAHLRDLLAARERFPESTILAEILYGSRDPFSRKIVIDKGSQHEIKAGQPVIDNLGVIGQVTRVYPWLSEITLVTDKDQVVPVQNLRNGLRAVVSGGGKDGQLELRFVPLNADFQNGDELVTSGIDAVYPPGLPVAMISAVERDAAYPFARIACRPVAGVASHGQVVILNWQNRSPARPAEDEKAPRGKKSRKGGTG